MNLTALPDFIEAFGRAIARQEGSLKPGSKGDRNHNPGNIRPWKFCSLPVRDGMIYFETMEDGWAQLHRQIRKNIVTRGLTTREFFRGKKDAKGRVVYAGYAPAEDGNKPDEYAAFVAALVGIRPVPKPDGTTLEAVDRVLLDVVSTWHTEPHESGAQREE